MNARALLARRGGIIIDLRAVGPPPLGRHSLSRSWTTRVIFSNFCDSSLNLHSGHAGLAERVAMRCSWVWEAYTVGLLVIARIQRCSYRVHSGVALSTPSRLLIATGVLYATAGLFPACHARHGRWVTAQGAISWRSVTGGDDGLSGMSRQRSRT